MISEGRVDLSHFPQYTDFEPICPIYAVTPPGRAFLHRFYDTSPISPSGRYIAVTEFLREDHSPRPGDEARVCVFDLVNGQEVFRENTKAWDSQVGCHAQWGESDKSLYFNTFHDDGWDSLGALRVNIETGERIKLDCPVYMVSPDGKSALAPDLLRISSVQSGYGVRVPDDVIRAREYDPGKDGVFHVDTRTGVRSLLASTRDIMSAACPGDWAKYSGEGQFYIFHVKWNPQGSRVLVIVRWNLLGAKHNRSRNYLISMTPEGKAPILLLSPTRWRGGHHPNWCPDGHRVVMNLVFQRASLNSLISIENILERVFRKVGLRWRPRLKELGFALIDSDTGSIHRVCANDVGSGHPTVDPTGSYVCTDAYPEEIISFGDGTVPIRFSMIDRSERMVLARIMTRPRYTGVDLDMRIDPHPAWSRCGRRVVFNACPEGKRQVFIADITSGSWSPYER